VDMRPSGSLFQEGPGLDGVRSMNKVIICELFPMREGKVPNRLQSGRHIPAIYRVDHGGGREE
jgi:hypothetical protein